MFDIKVRIAAVCAVLAGAAIAADAPEDPLVAEVRKSPEFRKAVAGKNKVVLCVRREVTGAARGEDMVEMSFFNYNNGKTVRATIDPKEKKVVKVESFEAYPTPLAEEEKRRAEVLAKEKDDKVIDMLKKYGGEVEFSHLAPVISNKKSPRFGKRIVILYARPKEAKGRSVMVTVDLTDEVVSRE